MKLTLIVALAIIWSLRLFAQQTINENVFFDSDKYTLTAEAESVLSKCTEQMKAKEIKQITIIGHADGSGREDYNTSLSQNRANAVWDYFVSKGVDKKKIQLEFHGQLEPAQTNDNEQGRKLNRRVNIKIEWRISPSHEVAKETDLHFEKQAQVFTLIPNKDTTLKCAEGTVITIKANSFVDEATGKPVTDSIRFSVAEYYKISDMLLAGLSTSSNGELLETGGMLNLKATANGRSLTLKKDETIQLKFASRQKQTDGFQLFTGKALEQNRIDWLTMNGSSSTMIDPVFFVVEEMPKFISGDLSSFVAQNVRYPVKARDEGIQGMVYVRFYIDETGEAKEFKIARSVSKELDSAAIAAFKNMPKWVPGKHQGVPVKVYQTYPVNFQLSDNKSTHGLLNFNSRKFNAIQQQNKDKLKKDFESTVVDTVRGNVKSEAIMGYIYNSSSLGWINCDRFLKISPKIDYTVKFDGNVTDVALVFDRYKSSLWASVLNADYSLHGYRNIPLNEKVTIIAIKRVENQYFLAIKKTKTKRETEQDFTFQPMTLQVLKEEMKKLDR